MKNFTNKIFILFIGIAVSLVTLAAENKLIEKSNNLAVLEVKQHTILRTWEYIIQNYIFAGLPVKLKNPEMASAEIYYSMPANKRNALKAENSKIKELEKLIPKSELLNISADIKKLRKEVKSHQEKEKDINLIKSEVVKFNNNETQIESTALDYILGIEYEATEASIKESSDHGPDLVIGHSKFYTQIDYAILREIFKNITITKNDIFYDLGSGYGRASFYGAILFPEGVFKGVEYIKERVDEAKAVAKNLKLQNVMFYASDVLKFDYSDGNIFFIFNPFPPLMPQVLAELNKISQKKKIRIIAMSNTVIELKVVPWLKLIRTIPNYTNKTPVAIFESINE